ncbi:MAG: hypothetical protein ACPLRX_09080 [Candidatus Saccharicenans sp.]
MVRFFQSLGEAVSKPDNPGSKAEKKRVMVKDEVCNTYIPEDEAIKHQDGGKVLYFCSEECRQKYLNSARRQG